MSTHEEANDGLGVASALAQSTLSGFKELRVTQRTSVESTDQIKERMRYAGHNNDFVHRFGPPLDWKIHGERPPPAIDCRILCQGLPREIMENELVQLFCDCAGDSGTLYELNLPMDPSNRDLNRNRGFVFVTYSTPEAAIQAVAQLNGFEVRPGHRMTVRLSGPDLRLVVGNVPPKLAEKELIKMFREKNLLDELKTNGFFRPNYAFDPKKHRKICFLSYKTHEAAMRARNVIIKGNLIFDPVTEMQPLVVDWADPEEELDTSKVKQLFVQNLPKDCTKEKLDGVFEKFDTVEIIWKSHKDFALVDFKMREDAERAMAELHGTYLLGAKLKISWARPERDEKKEERIFGDQEKRLMVSQFGYSIFHWLGSDAKRVKLN